MLWIGRGILKYQDGRTKQRVYGVNMPSIRGHGGFVYWAMRLAKLLLLCRPSVTLIVWKPQ